MKKLKLNVELLRVQSFDTGPGMGLGDLRDTGTCQNSDCMCGGVGAFADTEDCASKKADTMCEPPPSGQQGCFRLMASHASATNVPDCHEFCC